MRILCDNFNLFCLTDISSSADMIGCVLTDLVGAGNPPAAKRGEFATYAFECTTRPCMALGETVARIEEDPLCLQVTGYLTLLRPVGSISDEIGRVG